MKYSIFGLLALGVVLCAEVNAEGLSPPLTLDSKTSEEQIKEEYKADRIVCGSMSGNAKEICIAEAKGREKVSKVEFIDRKKNTAKSRYDVLMTKAQVNFEVAEERCDEYTGSKKVVCLNQAKASMVAEKAHAEAQVLLSKTRETVDD